MRSLCLHSVPEHHETESPSLAEIASQHPQIPKQRTSLTQTGCKIPRYHFVQRSLQRQHGRNQHQILFAGKCHVTIGQDFVSRQEDSGQSIQPTDTLFLTSPFSTFCVILSKYDTQRDTTPKVASLDNLLQLAISDWSQ